MNFYNEELQRLYHDVMEKKRTDTKLKDLYVQRKEMETKAQNLKEIMLQEKKDVDRLNAKSLSAFFYRATGKIGEKMTKEEEEAYAAAVKYEAAENALRAIDGDIAYYERKALQLQNCEAEYQKMLEKKKEQIKNAEIPGAEKIAEIERRLIFLQHQKKEVEEALEAGEKALSVANQILKSLDSAKSWSTVDLFGGGLVTDLMKHDHLKQVQAKTQELQTALHSFRTELSDVTERISGDIQVEIGSFLHFADYFFDGLFTDWLVYDKIKKSRERAQSTCFQIQNVLEQLKRMYGEMATEQRMKENEMEQLVLQL